MRKKRWEESERVKRGRNGENFSFFGEGWNFPDPSKTIDLSPSTVPHLSLIHSLPSTVPHPPSHSLFPIFLIICPILLFCDITDAFPLQFSDSRTQEGHRNFKTRYLLYNIQGKLLSKQTENFAIRGPAGHVDALTSSIGVHHSDDVHSSCSVKNYSRRRFKNCQFICNFSVSLSLMRTFNV